MSDKTQKDPKEWISEEDPMTGAQALISRLLPSRRTNQFPKSTT
jgi:Protein of unknown function (DUF3072)